MDLVVQISPQPQFMPFPPRGLCLPQFMVRAKGKAAALLPTAFGFWAGRPILAEASHTRLLQTPV